MGQRPLILSSILILLLGFFSSQGTLTGYVVQEVQQQDLSYDLTSDGVVDTADLQEVMDIASYGIYKEQADFNHDTVVDQLDVDLLASALSL